MKLRSEISSHFMIVESAEEDYPKFLKSDKSGGEEMFYWQGGYYNVRKFSHDFHANAMQRIMGGQIVEVVESFSLRPDPDRNSPVRKETYTMPEIIR
jgi:hypothetical protein